MTRLVIAFALFFAVASCKNENKVPRNVLSQEKMEALLQDMMKTDQFLSDYVLNRDTSKKRETESIKLYNQVFTIHKVEAENFFKSLDFYQQHPSLLKDIFDSISKKAERSPAKIIPTIAD